MKKMCKRGESPMALEMTIFIILNIVFFIVMLGSVYTSGNKEFVYEQTYAKEIALIIDNAKPETVILLDISKLVEIAKDNKKDVNEIIKLNKEENKIFVSLKADRGYSYKYFTNADINFGVEDNNLVISIE